MIATLRRADRVLLHDITWEPFESLLKNLGDHRSSRIAYDNGVLERSAASSRDLVLRQWEFDGVSLAGGCGCRSGR